MHIFALLKFIHIFMNFNLQFQDQFSRARAGDIETDHGKILTPIFLILAVCWSVFWTLPRELESRLTVTIVCFLALVAYNFVITEDLPQLPYMTLMDYIIIASYIFAALPTILSIISHRYFENNQLASLKVDRYAKFIGPPSYALILYIIMHMQVTETNSINAIKLLTFN